MKVYAVGGSVRDQLLGLTPTDNDYVVVGATEADMLEKGFQKVVTTTGFPVFLHPETGEEYALARKERSTGPGYHDFEIVYTPDVTIEEDLARRDFTMNSIARDIEKGEIIDPFGGQEDIKNRIIRNVNTSAFREDPVRVLRLARFAAKFPAFKITSLTCADAYSGNLNDAAKERVWLELSKALMTVKPSKFFDALLFDIFNLSGIDLFKEIYNLWKVPQPIKHHAEGCAYTHTMMALDSAAKYNAPLAVRFGCLVHDLGKAATQETWPSHIMHEIKGVPLVDAFCDRLKISNDLRKAGTMSAKYHTHVHRAYELKPKTYIKVYEDIKSDWKNLSSIIGNVALFDNEGKLPYEDYGDNHLHFQSCIATVAGEKLSNEYSQEEIDAMSIDKRKQVLHSMRLNSLKDHNF